MTLVTQNFGMADKDLLDSHLSLKQCKLAVEALHTNQTKLRAEKEKDELLPSKEPNIWLVLAVKKMQPKQKIMPFRM